MAAKKSVLGLIPSSSPYLRSALGGLAPFFFFSFLPYFERGKHSKTRAIIPLHITAMHCNTRYYNTMHFNSSYYTALPYNRMYCTAMYTTLLHCIELYCSARQCTDLCCTAVHCDALCSTVLNCAALHFSTPHYTSLHCHTIKVAKRPSSPHSQDTLKEDCYKHLKYAIRPTKQECKYAWEFSLFFPHPFCTIYF